MNTARTQNPTPGSAPAVPAPKRRPRGHLMLKVLGAFAILGLLVFFLVPVVASTSWARKRIVQGLDEVFDAPVSLEEHCFGWFSGLELRKLRIGNPRSFPEQGDLLRLEEASLGISLVPFLWGDKRVVLAKADGLEIRLHQLADGRTNLDRILPTRTQWNVRWQPRSDPSNRPAPARPPEAKHGDAAKDVLAHLDLDLALTHALIEVTDAKLGTLESLRNLNAGLRKKAGDLDTVLKLDVELPHHASPPGRLSMRGDIDLGRSRPSTLHFEVTGLDLARYRPLLDWAAANPFEELEGVLTGKLDVTWRPDRSTTTAGRVVLSRPRLKTLGKDGIDLRGEALVLEPNASFRLGEEGHGMLDLARFRADLGFLQATGIDGSGAAGLVGGRQAPGLRFTLDLAGLTHLGGIVPKELRGSRGTVKGQLLVESLDLERRRLPVQLSVECQDGTVRGNTVRLLRYALPLLAGLDVEEELDFESNIKTRIKLSGPLLRWDNESTLQWLAHWQGEGEVNLTDGGFTPATQLGEFLALVGEGSRLTFKGIDTDFLVNEGVVETRLQKMRRKEQTYGLRGKVFLDGRIDYRIALGDALRGHRDGERILRYLGGAALEARLEGTLKDPKLTMPSLGNSLDGLLRRGKKNQ